MKTINCHNFYHLGDCIETLHFLINATKHNDVSFNFLCNPTYHHQLQEFIGNTDKIKLINELKESSIDTWIGAYNYGDICKKSDEIFGKDSDQGTFFLLLSKILSNIMNIKCPFIYKNDMIYNQETLNKKCKHTQTYDYLFINSKNQSIPFPNFEQEIVSMMKILKTKNRSVITTAKVDNTPCTLDYNLSVVEIARLSKNVKNIIAVNTGPLHLCMNKWSLPTIEKFIVWSPAETFNYGSNFKSVKFLSEIEESSI